MSTQRTGVSSRTRWPGNYLSLDGGYKASSGLPALYILQEILERLEWDCKSGTVTLPSDIKPDEIALPSNWFGLFIGTGTGAIDAVLLGRLRMSPSQALEAYMKLLPYLAVGPAKDDEERKRNTEAFEAAFTKILIDTGLSADTPLLDETAPKTAICTLRTTSAATPYFLRSYRVRGSRPPDCTILQAACASIATIDRFLPVTIGLLHSRLDLIDATVGYANPTQTLLQEAQLLYGESEKVSNILSIGSGKAELLNLGKLGEEDTVLNQVGASRERVHQELRSRLRTTGIYFRFNPVQHAESEGSMLASISTYLDKGETNTRLDEATRNLHGGVAKITLKDISSVTTITAPMRPRPSLVPYFVGREEILDSLRQLHFYELVAESRMPVVSVLRGLGGSGKTQIALKLVPEFEEKFPGLPVYFLDASSESSLGTDYQNLIRSQGSSYLSMSHKDALAWLATEQKQWLAILDNADDPSLDLFQYIPKSPHGHVIITTRNDTYAVLAPDSTHHVEGLGIKEAISLLLRVSQHTDNDDNQAFASKIVQAVGYLPLAVTHAGAYIGIHLCISTYLEVYNQNKVDIMLSQPCMLPQDYRTSVATTIQMSLDRLSPEGRDVLKVFAHLDAKLIACDIIQQSAEREFCEIDERAEEEALDKRSIKQAKVLKAIFCPSGKWNELDLNKIIQACLQYSLLRVTVQGKAKFYSMHVLVQSYLKSTSTVIRDCRSNQLAIRLLGSAVIIDYDYAYLAYNRLLVPHVRLIEMADVIEAGDFRCFANVLGEQGSALLATRHLEYCLEMRNHFLGHDHIDTVCAMADLTVSYSRVGRYQDAVELGEKVLEMQKQLLGDNHPGTMRAMSILVPSYSDVGRYKDAMELGEKVLEMRKQLLGDDHPDTVRAMNNLTVSYLGLGRYRDAMKLGKKVLELWKQKLGHNHPDTVLAMSNLATSYSYVGQYQDAMELGEKVLEMRKQLLGDDHPDTVRAMNNLTILYLDVGRCRDATKLGEKVLEIWKQMVGDNHPDTILAMNNLAISYSNMGRFQDAVELKEKVLEMWKQMLGDDHPDTMLAMSNLAVSYSDVERYQDAIELGENALEMRKQLLGDDHPDTARAMNNLAFSYSDVGRSQDAVKLGEKALEIWKHVLGDNHPDTLLAMSNLALYRKSGEVRETLGRR